MVMRSFLINMTYCIKFFIIVMYMGRYSDSVSVFVCRLPGGLLCEAPASAFVPLGNADSQIILSGINKFCNETNPEVISQF